ncbi:nickel import ATP-binding protein NikE [Streptomyces sp. SPB78]|nr:nickel import ATP-binding protein NikE [Streptomyces sp. SPB78]
MHLRPALRPRGRHLRGRAPRPAPHRRRPPARLPPPGPGRSPDPRGSRPMTSTPPVLEVRDLQRHFTAAKGTVRAVDGVSLTIGPGEVVGLVGESGSGKSTVGRCVVRLDQPTGGTVRINGTDVTTLSRRALRPLRKDFHLVFQDPSSSLDPRMSVRQIIAEPLRLHRLADRKGAAEKADALLAQVGLRPELGDRSPHELSGGQRQRVSIARALSVDPSLLVADEPTSALDVSVQAAVLNLLADLQRERGFGCLFITHDLAAVEYLADRIAVMYLGRIVEQAPAAELFAAPKHPYTQALLSAAPVPDPEEQRTRERIVLGGDLPSPLDPPPGCHFHTRCPLATDRCRTETPALRTLPGSTREVACHLVTDDGTAPDATRAAVSA